MKTNDFEILQIASALQRLIINRLDSKSRYAATRNVQIVKPLIEASLAAFPEPTDNKSEWQEQLKKNEREFEPYLFSYVPEFDDAAFLVQYLKENPACDENEAELKLNNQNQAIMLAIMPLVKT